MTKTDIFFFNPFLEEIAINRIGSNHIVNSMIALTKSFALFFSAFTALALETFAWDITSWISISTQLSSTSSSSSSASGKE